eukprot:Nk52_evm15s218 gene=Nk52_evmTU15s218
MGSLFRSEEMCLVQLFIQSEAAYDTVTELGELGLLQFNDLNAEVNAFQRTFVKEVKRCEEMERKLRFFSKQIVKSELPMDVLTADEESSIRAPNVNEMDELEIRFEELEKELKGLNSNEEMLQRNFLELTELRQILKKTAIFFEEAGRRSFQDQPIDDRTPMLGYNEDIETGGDRNRVAKLGFTAGVIAREKVAGFERLLWRACHGNVFMRQAHIEQALHDPSTGEPSLKNVFVIFYQGETLQNKVKRICEGFGATVYPCPESTNERRDLALQVMTRIDDLQSVLHKTSEHRRRVLSNAALSLPSWTVQVTKTKSTYHALNMFNFDVTHKCLIAEAWCPVKSINDVQYALGRAAERSGSSVPSILNRMTTFSSPPTFHKTNKFTAGFQNIIDAYGVADYRECNPGPFTVITFPFLFAVMFGDFGHGFLMTLAAAAMLIKEKQLMNYRNGGEMFDTVFGGRYIIFLMGIFSMYTGMIYNDTFSKPLDLFGSSWTLPPEEEAGESIHLSPTASFSGTPYPFGIDPMWNIADNKLTFTNSYKMKSAVILGVMQMSFGVVLSLYNHRYFKKPLNVWAEFVPQMIFLQSIFGYLSIMIVYKWCTNWWIVAEESIVRFPGLLLTLINMFLAYGTVNPQDQLFSGQAFVQCTLVLIALVCVPWMLLIKPFYLKKQHESKSENRPRRRSRAASTSSLASDTGLLPAGENSGGVIEGGHDDEEFDFGDIMVHQSIHTIEFCLGAISNTASYLRLWALSLAHAQLSEVLWDMILTQGLNGGPAILVPAFFVWAVLSIAVLLLMEGMSAFLHALRLHWVEFQNKFYGGTGYLFVPFSFNRILADLNSE